LISRIVGWNLKHFDDQLFPYFDTIRYEGFSHTHPSKEKNGSEFSDFINMEGQPFNAFGGDQGATLISGKCCMIDGNGNVYGTDIERALHALIEGESLNDESGKYRTSYGHYQE